MSAHLSVSGRFEIFDRTVRGMEQRLLKVRQPPQMMTALRWGMEELDQALADAPARVRASVACRAGCAHCCSVPVTCNRAMRQFDTTWEWHISI